MNKKGNKIYLSQSDILEKIDECYIKSKLDISILSKIKDILNIAEKLNYLSMFDIEWYTLDKLIKLLKQKKIKIFNKNLLKIAFDPIVIFIYFNQNKPNRKILTIFNKRIKKNTETEAEEIIIKIASSSDYYSELVINNKITKLNEFLKLNKELKIIYEFLINNDNLRTAFKNVFKQIELDILYKWFSNGYIKLNALSELVDTNLSPKDNETIFYENITGLEGYKRKTVKESIRKAYYSKTNIKKAQLIKTKKEALLLIGDF